jgi:hypothetical protein
MSSAMELLYNTSVNKKSENQNKELTKIYLDVPYNIKDELKEFGIQWDMTCKKWFIFENNTNAEKINLLITENNNIIVKKINLDVPFQLKDTLKEFGIKWNATLKTWYINDNNKNKKKILELIKEYNKKKQNDLKK